MTSTVKKIVDALVREGLIQRYNHCRASAMVEEHLMDFVEEAKLNIMGPMGAFGCLGVGFILGCLIGKWMF